MKKNKRKKGDVEILEKPSTDTRTQEPTPKQADWGILEPLHGILSPVADVISPLVNIQTFVIFLLFLLLISWFKGPKARRADGHVGFSTMSTPERMAAYEELWRVEESELWDWMDERIGMHKMTYPLSDKEEQSSETRAQNSKPPQDREMKARVAQEAMNDREIDHAIRVTEERLEQLKTTIQKKRHGGGG